MVLSVNSLFYSSTGLCSCVLHFPDTFMSTRTITFRQWRIKDISMGEFGTRGEARPEHSNGGGGGVDFLELEVVM